MMLLRNQVSLVTGAGSGIGREVALAFAREGARVVVADVDVEEGKKTVANIGSQGSGAASAAFIRMDVAKPADQDAAVTLAKARFGALHIACNNAGIARGSLQAAAPLAQISAQDWQRVIDVNLSGIFHGLRAQIPAMLEAGGGAIANVASVLGQVGNLSLSPYVASKHGIVGLTRAAALDYPQQGVRINAVGPEHVFRHCWAPGDLVLWDNRATLHRGRPWQGSEPRLMFRTTTGATEADGLASVRPQTLEAIA